MTEHSVIYMISMVTIGLSFWFIFVNKKYRAKTNELQQSLASAKEGLMEKHNIAEDLAKKKDELQLIQDRLVLQQREIEAEKNKLDEKNRKIWKMSEAALKEKHKIEETNQFLQEEKEKLEAEKKKLDEKVKKLWQTSITIHKEKERVSELNDLLAIEKDKTDQLLAELKIKNKEITDNINYAQRIQSAILPDIKLIHKKLPQSFILFQPKDIVSGDFYSYAEKNGKVLLIAGDCTGHGVSGAFMSMVGNSLLNHIINEKHIYQPALILNELNIAVIETLNQSENESSDGMDVCICSFDLVNNQLEYAGANRPLWILRNNEFTIMKPDKFPIGGLQMARERIFSNVVIDLQPADTIYLFTDGYADQFGGENGKKMMTARFREILLSIADHNLPGQEHMLRNHFANWQGEHEQVDDVLVMGVRL